MFISSSQVWGIGGEKGLGEALEAREKQRELVAAQINKARQVRDWVTLNLLEKVSIPPPPLEVMPGRGREDRPVTWMHAASCLP